MNVNPSFPPATEASADDERTTLVQEMSEADLFSFAARVACMMPSVFDATVAELLHIEVAGTHA